VLGYGGIRDCEQSEAIQTARVENIWIATSRSHRAGVARTRWLLRRGVPVTAISRC